VHLVGFYYKTVNRILSMKPYFYQGSCAKLPLYLVLRVAYDYLETNAFVIGNTTRMSRLTITEKSVAHSVPYPWAQ
jgi:hypothetical protein